MSKVRILDAEFELNLFNLEDAKRTEAAVAAFEAARNAIAEKVSSMKTSQLIEAMCHATFDCLDEIFGKGAAEQIFGDTCDLLLCGEAIAQLGKALTETQAAAFRDKLSAYLPSQETL